MAAVTISITSLNIITFSITTLIKTAFSIASLNILGLFITVSINDT